VDTEPSLKWTRTEGEIDGDIMAYTDREIKKFMWKHNKA
jgi:hypothetical protein